MATRAQRLGRPPLPDGLIGVGVARGVVPLLLKAGVDPAPIAAKLGLPLQAFEEGDNGVVPFKTLAGFFALAAERTGYADIGLRVGQGVSFEALGLVGGLVRTAPTVGDALLRMQAYLHLRDQAAVSFLVREGVSALLGYELLVKRIEGSEQIVYGSLAIGANMLRDLCGAGFAPVEVEFAYRRPTRWSHFRVAFGAPVRFERTRNALRFDAAWLDRAVVTADSSAHEALLLQAEEATERDHLVHDRVARTIRTLLMAGRYSEQQVAMVFGVSRRTLSRRLQEAGCSFRALLDQARFDAACLLLNDTTVSLEAISTQLRYSDSTAFIRAFRRWSGTTPRRWRETNRATEPSSSRFPE